MIRVRSAVPDCGLVEPRQSFKRLSRVLELRVDGRQAILCIPEPRVARARVWTTRAEQRRARVEQLCVGVEQVKSSQVKCICMGTHQLFPAPVLARWSVSFVLKPVPIPIYPMLGYLLTVF